MNNYLNTIKKHLSCREQMIMYRLIVIFFSISLISCNRYKTHDELITTFYENKKALDSFVTVLQNNSKLDSVFRIMPYTGLPDIEKSYPEEYKFLNNLGIKELTSHPCDRKVNWYFIITNWPDKYSVCLTFSPCDSIETAKGFYKKDHYSNEWWGLGDNWQMFRFVKIIDYMKL